MHFSFQRPGERFGPEELVVQVELRKMQADRIMDAQSQRLIPWEGPWLRGTLRDDKDGPPDPIAPVAAKGKNWVLFCTTNNA
jgi:hypothetical protein